MRLAAVVVGTCCAIAFPPLMWAHRASARRVVVSDRVVRLVESSGERVIDLEFLTGLSKRRVRMGKSSYVAYFLLAAGGETMLFSEGAYPDQDRILALIAERSRHRWENA